jgi:hypothetical protein
LVKNAINNISWEIPVYPENIVRIAHKNHRPPRVIFVPSPNMAKAMVRTLLEKPAKESDDNWCIKFGLTETDFMNSLDSNDSDESSTN